MGSGQFITVRESAQLLGTSEKKIMELIEAKDLQAYKIADQFLRLKRVDVLQIKNSGEVTSDNTKYPYTTSERLQDFFFYNDFYLISVLLIFTLLYIIFFR